MPFSPPYRAWTILSYVFLVFPHHNTHVLMAFLMYTALPEFKGFLSAVSAVNIITISWTPLQFEPTSYNLTSVCWLQCNNAALSPIVPTPSSSDTSVIISGLPAESECNVTLAATYNGDSNMPVNLIAKTLLDGTYFLYSYECYILIF